MRYTLLLTLALIGCTKTPPVAVPVPPPRVAAAVSPAVAIARQEASKAGVVAARLEGQVEDLQAVTVDLRDGMEAAMVELTKLRSAKVANESELEGLWTMFTKETERAKLLFAEVEKANASAMEHRQARLIAEKRIDEVVKIAAERDAEAVALRDQNTALRIAVDTAADYRAKQDAKILNLQGDAALGKQLKVASIVIASSLGLGLALWIGLKFLKPF